MISFPSTMRHKTAYISIKNWGVLKLLTGRVCIYIQIKHLENSLLSTLKCYIKMTCYCSLYVWCTLLPSTSERMYVLWFVCGVVLYEHEICFDCRTLNRLCNEIFRLDLVTCPSSWAWYGGSPAVTLSPSRKPSLVISASAASSTEGGGPNSSSSAGEGAREKKTGKGFCKVSVCQSKLNCK